MEISIVIPYEFAQTLKDQWRVRVNKHTEFELSGSTIGASAFNNLMNIDTHDISRIEELFQPTGNPICIWHYLGNVAGLIDLQEVHSNMSAAQDLVTYVAKQEEMYHTSDRTLRDILVWCEVTVHLRTIERTTEATTGPRTVAVLPAMESQLQILESRFPHLKRGLKRGEITVNGVTTSVVEPKTLILKSFGRGELPCVTSMDQFGYTVEEPVEMIPPVILPQRGMTAVTVPIDDQTYHMDDAIPKPAPMVYGSVAHLNGLGMMMHVLGKGKSNADLVLPLPED